MGVQSKNGAAGQSRDHKQPCWIYGAIGEADALSHEMDSLCVAEFAQQGTSSYYTFIDISGGSGKYKRSYASSSKVSCTNGNNLPPTAIDLDKMLLNDLLFNLSPAKDEYQISVPHAIFEKVSNQMVTKDELASHQSINCEA
ncbi:hypothetical protein Tco_1397933, partial [Tanacetum coccineum]